MLNKFKYCTSMLLLQEVAAYTHIYTRAHTHSFKPFFVNRLFGGVLSLTCFMIESDTKRNWLQRRINSTQSTKKTEPPYHFIKITLNAFFSLWSQRECCVWLSRAFGKESTSLMCFNKHNLDCSLVLFWSVEMSLLFNSLCWSHSCWQHPGPPNKVNTVTGTGHVRQNTPFLISFVRK